MQNIIKNPQILMLLKMKDGKKYLMSFETYYSELIMLIILSLKTIFY